MYFHEAELKILFNFSKSTTPPFWYIEKKTEVLSISLFCDCLEKILCI